MLYLFNVYGLVVIAVFIVAFAGLLVSYASVMSAVFISRLLHTVKNSMAASARAARGVSPIQIPDDFVEG